MISGDLCKETVELLKGALLSTAVKYHVAQLILHNNHSHTQLL